jgi:hypothetical protein
MTMEGLRIKKIRPMTPQELAAEGWNRPRGQIVVIELDDGTILYPSRDEEGNGPGEIFGRSKGGKSFMLAIEQPAGGAQ